MVVCEYFDSVTYTGRNYTGDPSPCISVCDESNISKSVIPFVTQKSPKKMTNPKKNEYTTKINASLLTT